MGKRAKRALSLLLVAILLLALGARGWALGDDVDYGGSDSSWDSGGSWDWDDDDDDDYYYYGGSDNGGGGGGDGGVFFVGVVMVVVVVLFLVLRNQKKSGRPRSAPTAATGRNADPASIQRLKAADPGFSEADIEAKVKNWVMMFEIAWCAGDMTPCRPFISDGLFNSYQQQLALMKQNGEKSCSEDLAVMNCNIDRWRQDGDKEYLDVYIKVKKRTYKVDRDDPQKVIKGDKATTYHLDYIWHLMRSAGAVTQNAGVRVMECPNCGAQTSVNQSGKCDYCGSTLVAEDFDWVLNKVDKLGQKSYR